MKYLFVFLVISSLTFACIGTSPSSTNNGQPTNSTEQEAKNLTIKMKRVLDLDTAQEEKILMINIVNLSVLKKLKETHQEYQISATQEKYRSEMKGVLNNSQYAKFLENFGSM